MSQRQTTFQFIMKCTLNMAIKLYYYYYNFSYYSVHQTDTHYIDSINPHTEPSTTVGRWHKWIRSFERMASAAGCSNVGQKRDLLLPTAGEAVQDIFYTLADTGTTYTQVRTKLTAQFTPKANVPFNRHVFYRAEQREGEPVAEFVTRLIHLAVSCEWWQCGRIYLWSSNWQMSFRPVKHNTASGLLKKRKHANHQSVKPGKLFMETQTQ